MDVSSNGFSDVCVEVALARGKRETGQDLSGAAISDVLLCEGLFHTEFFQFPFQQ